MKYVSAFLRIVFGCALTAVAGFVYLTTRAGLETNANIMKLELFGESMDVEPATVLYGTYGAGGLGILLIVLGLVTIMRASKPKAAVDKPADQVAT